MTEIREAGLRGKGAWVIADVISVLREQDGQLPAQEQKVADYVKEHLDQISTMTIAELADAAGVSTPTVIRFCRSLGCDGFREFKLRLAQNLAVSMQYLQVGRESDPPMTGSAIDKVTASLLATIAAMRRQLDPSQLDGAGWIIRNGRQLVVGGIGGGSSMVAEEAMNRFFRLGIPTAAVSDSYLLQMRAATLRQGDVLLLISTSGEADAIVSAARIAAGYGATVIALTKPETRLATSSHILIGMDLSEDADINKPTASRYAFLIVLDALATTLAQTQQDKTAENLRRIRASLTAYHGRTGPQPLGD